MLMTSLNWMPVNIGAEDTSLLDWAGAGDDLLQNDDIPWSSLEELSRLEQRRGFKLKVIILTMNRPESLRRLLDSLNRTFFEHPGDALDVEIHVDKSRGK